MVALSLPPVGKASRRCRYQDQDSGQTLAEGLAEYYAHNQGRVLPPDALPPESAELFESHDICHVIFGLDTTLADEAMADTRTLLSCDVGWRRYGRYMASDPQAQAILRQVGVLTAVWGAIRVVPRMLMAIGEAWRAPKRWPWRPQPAYRRRTLADLRREFGIRVI